MKNASTVALQTFKTFLRQLIGINDRKPAVMRTKTCKENSRQCTYRIQEANTIVGNIDSRRMTRSYKVIDAKQAWSGIFLFN